MKSFNIGNLRIPVPVIQGGMGIGISLSGLASAVANMGGIGVISSVGIGFIENHPLGSLRQKHIEAMRKEIKEARKKTRGILGVNIMSVITNFSDMVQTSIEEGIDIIFAGAGLPLDLPKYLEKGKGIKTKLVPIISSGRAASIICTKWKKNFNYLPDALVVEGPKAGGHLGFKAHQLESENNALEKIMTEVLTVTREMKNRFNKEIPVIAAGGIFSGSDIFKIIKKGAAAVQMGTRFVATEECDASPAFKNAFIKAGEGDIEIIKSPAGMPGRSISGPFLREVEGGQRKPSVCKYNCIKSCDPATTSFCIASALLAAYRGNLADGFAFTGTNATKITRISTVEEIFSELRKEYREEEENSQNL